MEWQPVSICIIEFIWLLIQSGIFFHQCWCLWCELWMWKTNWKTYNSSFFGLSQRQLKRSKKKPLEKTSGLLKSNFYCYHHVIFNHFKLIENYYVKKIASKLKYMTFTVIWGFIYSRKFLHLIWPNHILHGNDDDDTKITFSDELSNRQTTESKYVYCTCSDISNCHIYYMYVAIKLIAFHRNVSPPQFMVWLHLTIKPKPIC